MPGCDDNSFIRNNLDIAEYTHYKHAAKQPYARLSDISMAMTSMGIYVLLKMMYIGAAIYVSLKYILLMTFRVC